MSQSIYAPIMFFMKQILKLYIFLHINFILLHTNSYVQEFILLLEDAQGFIACYQICI